MKQQGNTRMAVLTGHGNLLEGSMSATSAEVNSERISMGFKSAIDVVCCTNHLPY